MGRPFSGDVSNDGKEDNVPLKRSIFRFFRKICTYKSGKNSLLLEEHNDTFDKLNTDDLTQI